MREVLVPTLNVGAEAAVGSTSGRDLLLRLRSSKVFVLIPEVVDRLRVVYAVLVGSVVGMGIAPVDGSLNAGFVGFLLASQRSSDYAMRRTEVASVPIVAIRRLAQDGGVHLAITQGFFPDNILTQVVVVVPVAYVVFFTIRIVVEVPRPGKVPLYIKETQHEG